MVFRRTERNILFIIQETETNYIKKGGDEKMRIMIMKTSYDGIYTQILQYNNFVCDNVTFVYYVRITCITIIILFIIFWFKLRINYYQKHINQ